MEIFRESVAQRDKFRSAANKLLNNCFLLKKKEETRNDYIFIQQNRKYFEEYFELLDYQLIVNEDQGVACLVNQSGTGRLRLKKAETILLLILRLLYLEKRKDLSLAEEVVVITEEIHSKYALLKVEQKGTMDKTLLRESMRVFRRYNLIHLMDTDVTDSGCRIKLYPSILFAIPVESVNAYYDEVMARTKKYIQGGEVSEDETTDTDTAD